MGRALAVSCALHGALLSLGVVVPWRDQPWRAAAVFPVSLVESAPDVSPEEPTRTAPSRPTTPRPEPSTTVRQRELPVQAQSPLAPDALKEPSGAGLLVSASMEERVRAHSFLAAEAARDEPSAPSAVSVSPTKAQASFAQSIAGNTTPSTQAGGQESRSEIRAPGPLTAALPPESPPTSRITQAARPSGGYQVRPLYPPAARRAGAEGTTLLMVHVLVDGSIGEVRIERSAGHTALDRAAADAVTQWHFEPAKSGSQAVAVWVVIPVEFRLKTGF